MKTCPLCYLLATEQVVKVSVYPRSWCSEKAVHSVVTELGSHDVTTDSACVGQFGMEG